jgi:hypothetical protein
MDPLSFAAHAMRPPYASDSPADEDRYYREHAADGRRHLKPVVLLIMIFIGFALVLTRTISCESRGIWQ